MRREDRSVRFLSLLEDAVKKLKDVLNSVEPSQLDRKKAVVYLRVSDASENVENQLIEIERFARERGYEIVHIEKDVDTSGTVPPWRRTAFMKMLEKAREEKAGTIILYDLSRLARNLETGAVTLYVLLDYFNIEFTSMQYLKDIADPNLRKKAIYDLLWLAELYVEDIKRRTLLGMERARREGKTCHRPPTPIDCNEIAEMARSGMSLRGIYRRLVEMGKLRYREDGKERVISYGWFLRRVHRDCKL